LFYNLKDVIINCIPDRIDHPNTVNTWARGNKNTRRNTRGSNSTPSNDGGNTNQSTESGSSTSGNGSGGGGGGGGNGNNGGNGGSGNSTWLRDLVQNELIAGLEDLIDLVEILREEYSSASAEIERELANIPTSPNLFWFRSHRNYNRVTRGLMYDTPRVLVETQSNYSEVIRSLLELERVSRYLNLVVSRLDIDNTQHFEADRAEYHRLRARLTRIYQQYNFIFSATRR